MEGLNHIGGIISGIVAGVITLAIVAVLVSNRASTGSIIGNSGSALANVIAAAVSPVTGQSVAPNLGSGSSSFPFLNAVNPSSLFSSNTFGSALP